MATVSWSSAASGNWATGSNWQGGNAPGSSDDAVIAVAGNYTVSVTAAINVASITISDASAALQFTHPGADSAVTGNVTNAGGLGVDALGAGGSTLTVGGSLTTSNALQVGNGGMTANALLTIDGGLSNSNGVTVDGGQAGTTGQITVAGAAPGTLTANYSLIANTGTAVLQWGSGGITQIGDGASHGGDLFIDGAHALAEVGATSSNSALANLATIASNGILELRDGASVTTANGLTIAGGTARLKVDGYGGSGGSAVTIGGNLANGSFGSFSDGGVTVGNSNMTVGDTLTVNGTIDNAGGIFDVIGGQAGAKAQVIVTGAAPGTLTGQYNVLANAGGAVLQWGSGGITQIGDGASNGGGLFLDGANALAEIGATNSNNALSNLATIASNGILDVRDAVQVTTSNGLTISGGSARLKVDGTGGSGGSHVTIGGNLANGSFGSFSDGGVTVGNSNMTAGDTLTVNGTIDNAGGILDVIGGQAGAKAQVIATGAAPGVLTGQYNLVANAGGAVLQWDSGGITQIGDGASNSGGLFLDGTNAFAEIGATNNNNALTNLATIASNGLLDLRDAVQVITSNGLTISGGSARLKVDGYGGGGGSHVTIGGNLANRSFGSFSDGGVTVGNSNMTAGDTLTVNGTIDNAGGIFDVIGGQASAKAQVIATGAAPGTLTGQYNVIGNAGGAVLQWGSGGITQIGDGASDGGGLFLDGTNAFAEVGATNNNNALNNLATIASNGILDVRDAVQVTTSGGLTISGGSARLKVDGYGGSGGSHVTIGGNLANGSFGSFGDGGVTVGNSNMTVGDTLTVNGTIDNTGGIFDVIGGQAGAKAQVIATGAAPGVLTGQYNIVAGAGGATMQWSSGAITQIGDGASNSGGLFLDGASAFAETGATNTNSALTNLATIATNGLLDVRDGTQVTTTNGLTITGGSGRLKIDSYGGSGGSAVTIGGNLINASTGSFGDGGVSIGGSNISVADTLTVNGTVDNTGGVFDVSGGGQASGHAQVIVTGAAQSTLTGTYNIVANAGGAVLQWGGGGITQIGDGASNGADLFIDGASAFAEVGATNSNNALTNLATIASNGLLDLRDGTQLSTSTGLIITGGSGRLKVDAYGGVGGSAVTIGGNLVNASSGSFGDGGVAVGFSNISTHTTLTVNGTVDNTGGILDVTGGLTGGLAQMIVTGAVAGTLTGQYNITANTGGAMLQWGSGGITQIGDGAGNGGGLLLDGANAFAEVGATNSDSALTNLATIAGNGLLDLRNSTTLTTAGNLTIQSGSGRLKVDAYGGLGGSDVTINGDLTNASSGSFGDGGVTVGSNNVSTGDTLTVNGTVQNNAGAQFDVAGNTNSAAAVPLLDVTGGFNNAGGVFIGANGVVSLSGGAYTQSGGDTEIIGTLSATGAVLLNGGTIDMAGGTLGASGLTIAAGASLTGSGTVSAAITSAGSIVASGGSLDLAGGLSGATPITIANGAAIELAGADSGSVTFGGSSGIFVLDDAVGFTGTIAGLAIGDTLVLRNINATGATATFDSGTNTSTLAIALAGGGTLNYTLAGNYAGASFAANHVGSDTQIAAVGAAVGQINTPLPVALGTVRQGATNPVPISITNNAPSGSAALDVSIGGENGGAVGSGNIVALAPGATDATDIKVGIGAGGAGVQTGTVTLDFASDLGGGNQAPLPGVNVAVTGTVYREAIAAITPVALYAHVGDPGVETLNVANVAAADGFSENLIATLIGTTGSLTATGSGPTGDIAAGASDAASLQLSFSTASAGVISGSALVALTSDGGTGAGSIDGLGTIALPSQAVPITINVNNFATAAVVAPSNFGTLTTIGNSETLDLGTVAENTGLFDLNFGVANTAIGPADVLSGSFAATAANGFSLSGLSPFSNLGAGQTIAAGVTLDTTVAGVVTQTITLQPTDSNPGGFSQVLPAETLTITGTVEVLPPPTITAPSTITAMTAVPALLDLSVDDPNQDTLPLVVTISDTTGALTAQTSGSATVSGNGSHTLTLTGDLTDLNRELATVAYSGAAVGTDTINVGIVDQHHASASQSIAVDVSPVPQTKPIFNSPGTETAVVGSLTGFGGLSVADPSAQANGDIVTVGFIAPSGTLTITGDYGGTIVGQGTGTLAIIGTVNQINEYLGDGLLGDIGNSLGGIAFGMLQGFIRHGTITAFTPDDLVTLGGGPEGKFFELGVASAAFAINSLIGLIPGNTPPSRADFIQTLTDIIGDAHIVSSNGAIFDFNAEGEFVLSAATSPGDSFDVQVRLQDFNNSPYASVVTQVAAQVGTDRVTFATGRPDTIWVDGSAATIDQTGSLVLSGGIVTQLAGNAYRITWNTGEVLNVTNYGDFLNASIAPGPNNDVGSLVGLATLADTPADQFQLVDGSILQSPLSSATMYGPFADAWRVPQADSLFDYGPGQTTATFTNSSFPAGIITLADLPASVVAQAASVVAAAGITDPAAAAAIEFDYIVSGGDPAIVAADAGYLSGVATTPVQPTRSGPPPVAIGVLADKAQIKGDNSTVTAVVFDAYLTSTSAVNEVINYAVVASAAGDLTAAAFGGSFPSGQVTIAAGQISSQFTIDVPAGALGNNPNSTLAVQLSATDGTPLFAPVTQTTIVQAIPGPPALPLLEALTNFGSFAYTGGNNYVLNLGDVQYGQPMPTLRFALVNGATAPSDLLSGTIDVAPVEGFTVTGTTLPAPLNGGDSYQGLNVTVNSIKFGPNSETITFSPVDSNITGFSKDLAPITLTINDTIVKPTMVFSYAWGDVHIITYNGLTYNFQGEGEFTLAKSRIPNDSFDIQMRLVPWGTGSSVTVISQVAVSVGKDRVTFDQSRADTVFVDGNPSTVSQSNSTINLDGGTLTQIDLGTWQVKWNTGEEATITNWDNKFFNISDGIPLAEPNMVGGLQGEDAGAANDFQLSDGTVLQQPLPASQLYGEFADSWRVTQGSSLFDYLPGQDTNTFTDRNFPADVVPLTGLPVEVTAPATQLVSSAGITDQGIAQQAELDYIATGDPIFIQAAQQVSTQVTDTTPVNTPNDLPVVPAVGVQANPTGYVEAASGPTTTTFDAYLTAPASGDIVVNYTVVAAGAGFVDAATFGGTLPSGSVTITAGSTLVPFTIDLPQGALGTLPQEKLEVQIAAPGGDPVFAPLAVATINNNTPEPGVGPIPQLLELTNFGTLTESSPTAYTLNLGTLTQGQTVSQVRLGIANQAVPPADELSGTFSPPIGTGFLITGNDLPGAILAGARYEGLYVAPQTSVLGSNTETLVFNPVDVNGSGFSAALAPITLTIVDTVAPLGTGQLNTPQTIVFPNVHVGTTDSQALNISNTGSVPISVTLSSASPIITQGTIGSLAVGATDTQSLAVGVDTSQAGAYSGIASVDFGSSDPQIDVFGNVFRLAAGTVTPVNAFVHVGDSGTLALNVGNIAAADGFSENLLASLASVTGDIGIAAAGPTGEIAAGGSDAATLQLDFSTALAGTISGTATVDLTSDGGTGTGSIDGLGTTTLAPVIAPVAITIDNFATAALEDASGIGAFAQSGTNYTLDLGTVAQGSGTIAVNLGVLNTAIGPADVLSGSLTASGSSAFTLGGTTAISGLAAGQANTGPIISLDTGTGGTFTETITLAATGSNPSGFSQVLPAETLTVTGTVALLAIAPAIASVSPTGPIDFGKVHVGDAANQTLDISNTATAGSASLDGSVQSTSGDAAGSGAFTGLAPGAPASTAIGVGINTGSAGNKNGSVVLGFVSDNGSGGLAGLPSQSIAVSGTVYREAAATILPFSEIVHVGDSGTATLTVRNTAPTDNFSEALIATLVGASGGINIANAGPTGDIAAGASDSSTLGISFSTAQAGTIAGTGTIALTSDGGTGTGSIDGLGKTALANQTAAVAITVNNFADAEIISDGNLTASGADAFTLDLGSTAQGSGALSANLRVLNDVTGPADWLSGTFTAGGGSQFSNSGFGTFGTIDAGGSLTAGSVSLSTSQAGVFSETITLTPVDSNAAGFSELLAAQTITVTGTVTPSAGAPGSGNSGGTSGGTGSSGDTGTTGSAPAVGAGTATGDVHMATYDGLHYDFQAVGSYLLTRSTVPGDDFQIQIQTAADAANNAVSFTVVEAAQVGSDVVTFAIDRPNLVWIDGTPDTTLSAANPVQVLNGGTIQALADGSVQLTWNTGQTLTVTSQGVCLDSSVALGTLAQPGSVEGLLGTASGNLANEFQLPNGAILTQPSDAEILDTFAPAWSVSGANSLLTGPGTNGTTAPFVLDTAGGTMQFIHADNPIVLQTNSAGQVLSAGDGANVLSDAGGLGATFQGTLAQFTHELLAGVSARDLIDVTDLGSIGLTTSFAGSADAGVLHLSSGVQSGELHLAGQLAGATFQARPDGHGGTLLSLH